MSLRKEMSGYISIEDYDAHEENHAYFKEMMDVMTEAIRARRPQPSKHLSILELGAGTGIFTKRLLTFENVSVVAVDLDAVCCGKLAHNLGHHENLVIVNADSREFTSEKKFDFIVSSFADHHIHMSDKNRYFAQVKQNLKPEGIFIVGDEFLREHNLNDHEARGAALKAYHGHIIDLALSRGQYVLANLEKEALISGLEEKGDFKLANSHYEGCLSDAKFLFQKVKIGPLDQDVGGVYVYIARCF